MTATSPLELSREPVAVGSQAALDVFFSFLIAASERADSREAALKGRVTGDHMV